MASKISKITKCGIPSYDTIRRVFLLLNPVEFQDCFQSWANNFKKQIDGETIAIDGKALKGSRDNTLGRKAIYMVSAWASENKIVLGQVKVNEESNEITAIPKLLELLDTTGCTVTIDAMGTQTKIAEKIIENGVVESSREIKGKISLKRRFYITSLENIDKFSKSVREHWGVENSLHWTLDVAFDEDRSTRKKGNSPANSTVLKHITLNLLRREKTLKRSINTKRSHACMNLKYLEKVVFG